MNPCFSNDPTHLPSCTPAAETVSTNESAHVVNGPSQSETSLEGGKGTSSPSSPIWLVMWATRNRLAPALRFFAELGIETFSPTEVVAYKVDGKIVKKEQPLISNKIFVHISLARLKQLRSQHPTSPFLFPVLDKTQGSEGCHPIMVIPQREMENFIRLTTVGDEHVLLVSDPSRLSRLDPDKEYIVVEGRHKGLVGQRVRYKKQERIVVKCGTLVFTTGYVPRIFVEAVKQSLGKPQ